MSRDQIVTLSSYGDRVAAIAPYIALLKRQAKIDHPLRVVAAGGTVRFPGEYPLVEGMSVNNLISLSGGLLESAYSQSAEIARLDLSNPNRAVSTIVLSSLNGASSEMLAPSDYVEFRTIPDYRETATISLQGEFVFPGVYAFDKGETLTSVIQRAGGFTDEAFIGGSVFLREALKVREQKELDRLAQVLNDDLNADRLRDVNSDIDVNESQLALQRNAVLALTSAEALGRLVIPLSDIVNFSVEDIILKANDRLLVPKFSQEVTVIGEVQRPTSYLYDASFSQADYLMQSGGIKPSADRRGIYVVKAGGQVVMPTRGFLRFRSPQANIGPGDTIVVPLDTDDTRIRGIPLLAEVSTIIYQLALGAAAVNSFSTP
jgi:protein involved in polysaccharide export with SLBB domain